MKLNLNLKSLGLNPIIDTEDDNISEIQEKIDDSVKALLDPLKKESKELATIKGKFEDFSIKALDNAISKSKEHGEFHKSLIEEILALGKLAGMIEDEKADEKRAFLKDMSFTQLSLQKDEYKKVVNEKYPRPSQVKQTIQDKESDEERVSNVPDSRFQTD